VVLARNDDDDTLWMQAAVFDAHFFLSAQHYSILKTCALQEKKKNNSGNALCWSKNKSISVVK